MVEGGGATAFPVFFFDGDREMDIGDVEITPVLKYKPFQQMVSKMIGISPNQISIYLVNRNRGHSPEERRRIPITGKFNFAAVCRQNQCSFLAVLKRSRKSRNRRDRMMMMMMMNGAGVENEFSPDPTPKNLILLQRNPEVGDSNGRLRLQDLNGLLQRLGMQEGEFQTSMAMGNANSPSDYGSDPGFNAKFYVDSFPLIEDIYRVNSTGLLTTAPGNETVKGVFCEECWNAQKNGAGIPAFHHCVNDAVVTCFNNRLAPINRPEKGKFL